jgi:L-malate glycosyltransferase
MRPLPPTLLSPRQVPSPLRVLHIDSGRAWRGGQRQVQLLAAGQRARGDEPLVVVQPRSPLYRHLKADGIAVASIRMRAVLDLLAVRRIRRLLATWRPALVHAHDPRSHSLALTALVGRRNSVPLVVTRRLPTPLRGGLRYSGRVARFVAISGAVREALLAGGVPEDRVVLVYPGVSRPAAVEPRDWRAECAWPPDAVVAGVVGPLATAEGFAALERIAAALPAPAAADLRFVVLGGPSVGRCTVGPVAAYRAGFVHDVHNAIAGLDLLLHPGTADGLGTAIIDGMALGVPSVSFGGGSVAEIVDPGRNGIVVPQDDTRAFAHELERLVRNPGLRTRLAEAGPARAAQFAAGTHVDGMTRVYRDLLGAGGV